MRINTTTDDVIIGAVQLEEKQFAGIERPELTVPRGLPEVHFIQLWTTAQEVKPVAVCYAYE